MKPKVFLTRRMPPAVMERLERETDLAWHSEDRVATKTEIIAGMKGRVGLLCNILDRVDAELLDSCPGLKVVANFGVGFNNIDVAAAIARKIPVTNTPGVLTDTTADMAFTLMLAVARRLGEGERLVRAQQWTGWQPLQLLGADVTGATLGILGFGRIGRAVAHRAQAFDMRVIYWNRTRLPASEEAGATYANFDDVLRESDFVSLHVAYNSETHHHLGEKQFALMKPTAFVINTARGAVIDEPALVQALRTKRIAGAGLDVFEREPQLEPGLCELENVVLAPHLGSATIGTRTKMGMIAVDNLLAVCAGQRPPNCVNPQVFG
ncbi:MAG TPA: D-glycerate dehydrogenase [Candidatus Limnocylindrales bacterium]|nr:D-glycerate dehydrogenase [Candidatus Limnocylindrales bacterium]